MWLKYEFFPKGGGGTVGQKGGLYQINSEVHISDQFRTIWDQLGPFGTIWDHLGPFGTIWDHLGPFGSIWVHLVGGYDKRPRPPPPQPFLPQHLKQGNHFPPSSRPSCPQSPVRAEVPTSNPPRTRPATSPGGRIISSIMRPQNQVHPRNQVHPGLTSGGLSGHMPAPELYPPLWGHPALSAVPNTSGERSSSSARHLYSYTVIHKPILFQCLFWD